VARGPHRFGHRGAGRCIRTVQDVSRIHRDHRAADADSIHIWRIAAALVFFWYGAHDLLPEAFVRNAGWGDLIAGLLALGVTLLPKTRNRYLVFHLFGFADFVVAVGTGLTYFLLNDPRMSRIQTLPMALTPFYGVGISGASHIMAFDLLRRRPGLSNAR
jgi:hypothetical protein